MEFFAMAPRANWKGYLKLSLVSRAIALYPATSETTRVRFNTINRKTGNRVKRQFIDPDTESEDVVDTENQVKGYAVPGIRFRRKPLQLFGMPCGTRRSSVVA
jgi:non-homologous end joining protein Ku